MDINKGTLDKLTGMMEGMEGKSENELINELATMIKSGQGGLTPKKTKQMIYAIMPMLDGNQKSKLNKLLKAIDR